MDLFGRKAKLLKKQLKETQLALQECNEKLHEKQEHINKTNAYWKKKIREVKLNVPSNLKKNKEL
jgi:K+ transporter